MPERQLTSQEFELLQKIGRVTIFMNDCTNGMSLPEEISRHILELCIEYASIKVKETLDKTIAVNAVLEKDLKPNQNLRVVYCVEGLPKKVGYYHTDISSHQSYLKIGESYDWLGLPPEWWLELIEEPETLSREEGDVRANATQTKDYLIAKQQLAIESFNRVMSNNEKVLKALSGLLYNIGAPLNDNILGLNDKQLEWVAKVALELKKISYR